MGTEKMNAEFHNLKATGDLHKNILFGTVGNDMGVQQRMGREVVETVRVLLERRTEKLIRKR